MSGEHMVERFETLIGSDHYILRLPTVGHYPQIEAPEAVLAGYRDFLAAVGAPRP